MPTALLAAIPQFTVPDLVRTTEYYRDVLGFQIAGWDGERVSDTADSLWCELLKSRRQSLTASSGFARVAACAGIQLAAIATRPRTAAAYTNTSGSVALTSNSSDRSTRVAA